mmetsp:Transcript_120589/g.385062  ORF Transcript_120589/g.385062 Transcript_120589/m.385062 type:complete len:264 (-) Transcript_120589:635-1426(-)
MAMQVQNASRLLTSRPTSHHLGSAKAIDVLIVESFSPKGETRASRIQKWSRLRLACELQSRQGPADAPAALRPEFVHATDGLLGHGQEDPSGFLGRICSRTSTLAGSAHTLTRHLCHGPNPDGQLCRRKLANLFEVHLTEDRGTQRGHLLDVEPNACNCPQTAVDSWKRQCSRQSSATQPFANAPTRPTAASLSLATDQTAVDSSCGDSSDRRSLLSWMRNLEKRLATHLQPGHLSANLPRAHSVFTSSEAAKLILGDDFTFT